MDIIFDLTLGVGDQRAQVALDITIVDLTADSNDEQALGIPIVDLTMETAGAQAPQAPHPAPIDLTTESDGERPFQAPILIDLTAEPDGELPPQAQGPIATPERAEALPALDEIGDDAMDLDFEYETDRDSDTVVSHDGGDDGRTPVGGDVMDIEAEPLQNDDRDYDGDDDDDDNDDKIGVSLCAICYRGRMRTLERCTLCRVATCKPCWSRYTDDQRRANGGYQRHLYFRAKCIMCRQVTTRERVVL